VLADFGIDHIHRDSDVVDVVGGNAIHQVGQHQAVGGQTEFDVWRGLGDELESLEGLLGIGQGIARAGDAKYRHLWNGGSHREHLFRSLFRRELLAHHAGARFIGAIILAVAVVALDVAGRRDSDVHARVMVMRFLAITGMVLHLLPDFGVHVLGPVGRTAARLT